MSVFQIVAVAWLAFTVGVIYLGYCHQLNKSAEKKRQAQERGYFAKVGDLEAF